MAEKRKTAAAAPPANVPERFSDDEFYTVVLSRPVKWAGQTLRPGSPMLLKGKVANANKDAILSATKA